MRYINSIRQMLRSVTVVASIAVFLVVPGLARCAASVDTEIDHKMQLSESSSYEKVSVSEG